MLSKEFFRGGRAVFTVSNPKGLRYTFRIVRKEANDRYPENWFAGLLTGPNNVTDYSYLGVFEPADLSVRMTPGSRYDEASVPVRVLRWVLARAAEGADLPAGYEVCHEGKCGRCGRALTVPESVASGIGPECSRIMGAARPKRAKTSESEEEIVEQLCSSDVPPTEVRDVSIGICLSDGYDGSLDDLEPVRDREGEITHWVGTPREGRFAGRKVSVFND